MYAPGQLIYYVQAVDVVGDRRLASQKALYVQALQVANMATTTKGLMGMLGFFMGMRMKLTKKLAPPEVVQEAPGEVVGVTFHAEEGFGLPNISGRAPYAPAASHSCWAKGWVLLDRLPQFLECRLDDSPEDYTGLGKRGVWHVEPENDSWDFECKAVSTIDHARASALTTRIHKIHAHLNRSQLPVAPEHDGTYNNFQGRTVREPSGEPIGHTIDLRKPGYLHDDEYKQHLYMILGRSMSLDWVLLQNFPVGKDGNYDWRWFEEGPPKYLCHVAVGHYSEEETYQQIGIPPPPPQSISLLQERFL